MGSRGVKAFLDTHVAVFLWEGRSDVWGTAAKELIERSVLFLSPVVRLELGFLREIGKLKVTPDEILGGLSMDCGVIQSSDRIEEVVARAMGLSWTRDPFDRLLVATALLNDAPLITRDRRILKHTPIAVW